MPTATIIKKSSLVRTLLIFAAITSPSTAAMYTARVGFGALGPNIYAFKPMDVIFPGFVQPGQRERPEGYQGFSGFVQEVRNAVLSRGGVPLVDLNRDTPFADSAAGITREDPTFASSIPIKLGPDSRPGNTAEVFLGFSVKQIVDQIPAAVPLTGDRPETGSRISRPQGPSLSAPASLGGSLGAGSNWLSGGFLSLGGSGANSGFGIDQKPLTFPSDLGNGPYVNPNADDPGTEKSLRALRKMVLDLVFNPFVYFTALIVSILMFMARFKSP